MTSLAAVGAAAEPPAAHRSGSRQSGSDYAELSRRVKAAGLLRQRPAYYVVKVALTAALLLACRAAFVLSGARGGS